MFCPLLTGVWIVFGLLCFLCLIVFFVHAGEASLVLSEGREGETRVETQSDRSGGFATAKRIFGFDGVSPSRLWTRRVRHCASEKSVVMPLTSQS